MVSLVQGFRNSVLYPIVAVAAFTGARRNEILALRWSDLNPVDKTLRIERALEETKASGRMLKDPKTVRGRRTIEIDGGLLGLLLAERDKHLQEFDRRLRPGNPIERGHAFRSKAATFSDEGDQAPLPAR